MTAARSIEVGGQASLCEGHFFDETTDDEIGRPFSELRNSEYAAITREARALAKALRMKKLSVERVTRIDGKIKKLRARFRDVVVAVDFFYASGREGAKGLVEGGVRSLAARRGDVPACETLERVPTPRGATCVTRTGVHVDRIASPWLIRRFIDPAGTLKFVPTKTYVPKQGELRFDMYKAEFTHVGDRCSFAVLVERMGLEDGALVAINELVHDIRDAKYVREETAGFGNTLTGICTAILEDEGRIAAATPMLDGRYACFARAKKGDGE